MHVWKHEWVHGWMREWVHGWMHDGFMGRCMSGWTDKLAAGRWIIGEQISKGSSEKGQSAQPRAGESSILADA